MGIELCYNIDMKLCNNCGENPRYSTSTYCKGCKEKKRNKKRNIERGKLLRCGVVYCDNKAERDSKYCTYCKRVLENDKFLLRLVAIRMKKDQGLLESTIEQLTSWLQILSPSVEDNWY